MKIGNIEIPNSEVEKLSDRKKKILYCLYDAYPRFSVTTWTIQDAGGSGHATRRKNLKEWLEKNYGLTIEKENHSSKKCTFWVYWIQESGVLPMPPRKFIGKVY
jgi:hypothetical protein